MFETVLLPRWGVRVTVWGWNPVVSEGRALLVVRRCPVVSVTPTRWRAHHQESIFPVRLVGGPLADGWRSEAGGLQDCTAELEVWSSGCVLPEWKTVHDVGGAGEVITQPALSPRDSQDLA